MVTLLIDEAKQLPKEGVMKMRVLPMYGALPAAEQMRVFERTPKSCRKVRGQIRNRADSLVIRYHKELSIPSECCCLSSHNVNSMLKLLTHLITTSLSFNMNKH